MRFLILFCLLGFQTLSLYSQFDSAAGKFGSKAIHMNDASFVAWGDFALLQRGWINAAKKDTGLATYGSIMDIYGKPDNKVLSLGDGGSVTYIFNTPVANGIGADFAVFENGISDTYLELAFVEVSSDGSHFIRFPSFSNTDTLAQIDAFGSLNPTKIYNLAGKYKTQYGTPFDLDDLKDSLGLNINRITHIRIVDVVGSLIDSLASFDSRGYKINDPWPTPFASSGFDLDAIGVINNTTNTTLLDMQNYKWYLYPMPITSGSILYIKTINQLPTEWVLYSTSGKLLQTGFSNEIVMPSSGIYFLQVAFDRTKSFQKIIVYE